MIDDFILHFAGMNPFDSEDPPYIKSIKDIYHLSAQKRQLLNAKGLGIGNWDWLFEKIEISRSCNLARFLLGIGIPSVGQESARKLDIYFESSFKKFEEAIQNEYDFSQIDGISNALNKKIYEWYYSEIEQAQWVPLIDELKFQGDNPTGNKSFSGKISLDGRNIAIVGITNFSVIETIKGELQKLGLNVSGEVTSDTEFMLISLKG